MKITVLENAVKKNVDLAILAVRETVVVIVQSVVVM